jgi:hypothetical protein
MGLVVNRGRRVQIPLLTNVELVDRVPLRVRSANPRRFDTFHTRILQPLQVVSERLRMLTFKRSYSGPR